MFLYTQHMITWHLALFHAMNAVILDFIILFLQICAVDSHYYDTVGIFMSGKS